MQLLLGDTYPEVNSTVGDRVDYHMVSSSPTLIFNVYNRLYMENKIHVK